MATLVSLHRPSLQAGDLVAYAGADMSAVAMWHGHPGWVILVDFDSGTRSWIPWVDFVHGPIIDLDPGDLQRIDAATFHRRSVRLSQGLHPLEDRDVPPFKPDRQDPPKDVRLVPRLPVRER